MEKSVKQRLVWDFTSIFPSVLERRSVGKEQTKKRRQPLGAAWRSLSSFPTVAVSHLLQLSRL